jgi:hypothetical protein
MARTGSKNSRLKSNVQVFIHNSCGGEIAMKSVFHGGKMKHFAQCNKCGEIKRRPSEF